LSELKELAPSPNAGAASGEEKTGSGAVSTVDPTSAAKDASGATTPTNTKENAKDGNLFTPGATATKGGRHRADTGSFAQGLRDTVKGLTGLGRDKKSESSSATSKSGEGTSSSSSSGSADSGGGSESK
jgi:hypothetical protein